MPSIDHLRAGQAYTTSRSTKPNVSTTGSDSGKSAGSKISRDSVSLSNQGKAIGEMHQQMASQPSFDAAKVASIKEAIANGSYIVDAERLANNILRFENEFAPA